MGGIKGKTGAARFRGPRLDATCNRSLQDGVFRRVNLDELAVSRLEGQADTDVENQAWDAGVLTYPPIMWL